MKTKKLVQFTKENQPPSEQKSKGWKRKRLLKDIMTMRVAGNSKEVAEKLAKYFDVEVTEIDIETLMHLKQIERAIKGDTRAYNDNDRCFG